MMYQYKMNSRRAGHKQHLAGPDGMTLCKAENGTVSLDLLLEDKDKNRAVCKICSLLADKGVTQASAGSKKKGPGGWTDFDIETANLVHGPNSSLSDTYRLRIEGTDDIAGKELDVPGWMVGDPEMALLRVRAANIIRKRIEREYEL